MLKHRLRTPVALSAMACFLLPGVAHAYLDPGSGSYILQILVAGIVAGLFTIKLFWLRLTGFCMRLFGRHNKPSDD